MYVLFCFVFVLVFASLSQAFRASLVNKPKRDKIFAIPKAFNGALVASTTMIPSAVFADDGGSSAFVWPLAISLFTMVPFLIYQQALKPKPRVVKQIELDDELRPKDKRNISTGKESEARATKRK